MGGRSAGKRGASQRYVEEDDDGFIVDDEGDDDEDERGGRGGGGAGRRKKKRSSDDEDAMEIDDEPTRWSWPNKKLKRPKEHVRKQPREGRRDAKIRTRFHVR